MPPLLLVIPPLTQLNTPYPSTAYLTGFLRSQGCSAAQADVGIEMVLALFSRAGLTRLFDRIRTLPGEIPGEARQMLALERVLRASPNQGQGRTRHFPSAPARAAPPWSRP